jgi:hypothetical protein
MPPLEVATSARDALSLIQIPVDETTMPIAISYVLRTLRIYDVRDIIHVGQLSYTALKDILGNTNYDAASTLLVDLHVLANYLMQSELFDLLAKHGTTEDAWAEFTKDIAGVTRHMDRTHMEQYGKEYATFLRVSSGQRESESVRSRSSRSNVSHTHRSHRDGHEDNRSASSTLDSSRRSRMSRKSLRSAQSKRSGKPETPSHARTHHSHAKTVKKDTDMPTVVTVHTKPT